MTEETPIQADLIRRFLDSRDAMCPVCAYNLRDNQTARCSECGAQLELCVASDHVRTGPWVMIAVSIALPMGFGMIFSLINTVLMITGRIPDSKDVIHDSILTVLIGCAGAVLLGCIVILRRRIWQMSAVHQWIFAGVFTAIILAIFSMLIWDLFMN